MRATADACVNKKKHDDRKVWSVHTRQMLTCRKGISQTIYSLFLDRAEFEQEALGFVFAGLSSKLAQRAPDCIFVGVPRKQARAHLAALLRRPAFVRRVFFSLGTSKTIHQYVKHSERTRDACGRPYTGRPCQLQPLGRALWAALLGRRSGSSASSEGQGKSEGSGQSQKPQSAQKSSSRAWTRKLGATDAPAAYTRRGPTRRGRWLDSRHVHARQECACSQIRWD